MGLRDIPEAANTSSSSSDRNPSANVIIFSSPVTLSLSKLEFVLGMLFQASQLFVGNGKAYQSHAPSLKVRSQPNSPKSDESEMSGNTN